MPAREDAASFVNVSVTPAVGATYRYRSVLPVGWIKQGDLPNPERVASADRFSALGVFSPALRMIPPVIVSFGAILAPQKAPVSIYFERYCQYQGYSILAMEPRRFFAGMVLDGLVTQEAPGWGSLLIRVAMFEDGGRLFALAGMAPAAVYERFVRPFSLAMRTFELQWPRGPTVPLV